MDQEQKSKVISQKVSSGWIYLIINAIIFAVLADMWSAATDAQGLAFWGFIGFILMCVLLLISLGLFIRDLIKRNGVMLLNACGIVGNLIIIAIYLYLAFFKV